jgi:hypothetical protein
LSDTTEGIGPSGDREIGKIKTPTQMTRMERMNAEQFKDVLSALIRLIRPIRVEVFRET